MDTPKIIIDGKTYTAKRPTFGMWRAIVGVSERLSNHAQPEQATNFLEMYGMVIGEVFGLTPEFVLNGLYLDEIRPKYIEVSTWIIAIVNGKLGKIPNVGSPESKSNFPGMN